MLQMNENWRLVVGLNGTGSDFEGVVARKKTDYTIEVVIITFECVKTYEFKADSCVVNDQSRYNDLAAFVSENGDDYEVALILGVDGEEVFVMVDSLGSCYTSGGATCNLFIEEEEWDVDALGEEYDQVHGLLGLS